MPRPKNPHPSGRPIRREEKKSRAIWYQYPPDPAVIYATPRLRPKPLGAPADAIGYKIIDAANEERDAIYGRIGFVVFP